MGITQSDGATAPVMRLERVTSPAVNLNTQRGIIIGNRAVITASRAIDVAGSNDIGVYLHWNGGRDSVEAFLTYCKMRGFRSPENDNYGWAYLCTVIGNFFGGGLSLGIDKCSNLDCDNWDNGVYVIKNWEIVDRKYMRGGEQRCHGMRDMLLAIDEAQPAKNQLGEEKIDAWLNENAPKEVD